MSKLTSDKIQNLLIEGGLSQDDAKYIVKDLVDNQGQRVISLKSMNIDKIFEIIGMFTELPKNIKIEDVIKYISGIVIEEDDIGKTIGGHKITKKDYDNEILVPVVRKSDVGKVIGGITIKEKDVNSIMSNLKPIEDDIGKSIGGIKITRDYVGRWLDGIIMLEEDIGKTLGDTVLTSIMVGNSLGGVNRNRIGFESPVYINSSFAYDIQIENQRNEMEGEEGTIKCDRCGSTETIMYHKQTRGGDEDMSIKWTCTKCGKKGTKR